MCLNSLTHECRDESKRLPPEIPQRFRCFFVLLDELGLEARKGFLINACKSVKWPTTLVMLLRRRTTTVMVSHSEFEDLSQYVDK